MHAQCTYKQTYTHPHFSENNFKKPYVCPQPAGLITSSRATIRPMDFLFRQLVEDY